MHFANMTVLYTLTITLCFFGFYCLIADHVIASKRLYKHKESVKTYKNEYGDIYDCVNVYQQPAFDHPLLVNHTIQMKPTWYPKSSQCSRRHPKLEKEWNITYNCPKGSIPILRSYEDGANNVNASPMIEFVKLGKSSGSRPVFGGSAIFDVWNPVVESPGEFSLAHVTLGSGYGTLNHNYISAGWMVSKPHDHHQGILPTKFFIRWTRDAFRRTGCFNLDCHGFVQTNHQVEIGGVLPINHNLGILIYKDHTTGHWWVLRDCVPVGYWPGNIFTTLSHGAEYAFFGGEVLDTKPAGRHTYTEMGSGRLSREGEGRAGTFEFVQVLERSGGESFTNLANPQLHVSTLMCYDGKLVDPLHQPYGVKLYYGGSGRRSLCQGWSSH